jgi:hypothetical protein
MFESLIFYPGLHGLFKKPSYATVPLKPLVPQGPFSLDYNTTCLLFIVNKKKEFTEIKIQGPTTLFLSSSVSVCLYLYSISSRLILEPMTNKTTLLYASPTVLPIRI